MEKSSRQLWASLLHLLFKVGPMPKVLVVHLGANNLRLLKGKALVLQARDNFWVILRKWPGVTIVWSMLVPQRAWRNARLPDAVEKVRKINREFQVFLEKGMGFYLMHPLLSSLAESL